MCSLVPRGKLFFYFNRKLIGVRLENVFAPFLHTIILAVMYIYGPHLFVILFPLDYFKGRRTHQRCKFEYSSLRSCTSFSFFLLYAEIVFASIGIYVC